MQLYAVYKCRLCGKLESNHNFDEPTVLATYSFLLDGEKFRDDTSIRTAVRQAESLRLVDEHRCVPGVVGLSDFVGYSRREINLALSQESEE